MKITKINHIHEILGCVQWQFRGVYIVEWLVYVVDLIYYPVHP